MTIIEMTIYKKTIVGYGLLLTVVFLLACGAPAYIAPTDVSTPTQKREWQELRSTNGVVLKYINLKEPTSGRNVLLVAFGTREDDIVGIDATLDVAINGQSIDAIVENVAQNKLVAENPK